MCCRTATRFLLISSLVAVVAALVVLPQTAFSQTCIQDEYNSFNGVNKTLSCTANDVSVAGIVEGTVNVFQGGFAGTNKCIAGGKFSFTAQFEIKTTSSKTRSNIGIFFGTGTQALTGTCTQAILAPPHPCAFVNGVSQATCGDNGTPTGYEELDQSINAETACTGTSSDTSCGCGDTSSTDSTTAFGASTQSAILEVDNVTCPTSGTTLVLPVCTGWYQPASTMPQCNTSFPNYGWVPAATPGTTSKCDCGTLNVTVQPVSPAVSVAKNCNLPPDTTAGLTTCDFGATNEGGNVLYTVTIDNTTPTGQGGVTIDQICDDRYGQIYPATGTCTAGTVGSISSFGGCTTTDIANGGSATCTFTVSHGENLTVIDQVSVTGHSDLNPNSTFGPTTSNTVTVKSGEAPSTAKTNKGLAGVPVFACVTERYNVTVTNTSSADESITLNSSTTGGGFVPALDDSFFGDITTDHGSASVAGSVTGTTCGVAVGSVGLGTLSGTTASSTNGGAFPATLAPGTGPAPTTNGGSYTCQFDGVICGTPAAITGVCSQGLTNVDTVTANLSVESGETGSVTQTDNQFTANICFTQSGQ